MGAVKNSFFDLHDCNGDSDWPEFWLGDHPNPCPICGTKWGDRHKPLPEPPDEQLATREQLERSAARLRDPRNDYDPVF